MPYQRTKASEAYGWGIREDDKCSSGFHYGGKSGLKVYKDKNYRGVVNTFFISKGSDHYHETAIAKDIARLRKKFNDK